MENENTDIRQLLESYAPSQDALNIVRSTPLLFLVGIAGAGKDTIKHQLLQKGEYHHIISHTTRPPRENHGVKEQDGIDYHFISMSEATTMAERQEFIEAKFVHGTVYGTSAAEIQKAHDAQKIALTDIDVQGLAEYKQLTDTVIGLFILPPDYDTWQQRLTSRYGDGGVDIADIDKRMHTAVSELEHALEVDYYHFILNDDLARVVQAADDIAHNHDTFNEKDAAARERAVQLLADIKAQLA